MKYAKVENNNVVSIGELPAVYENVSGFNGLSDAELATYGFLPYSETIPEFNTATQKLVTDPVEILADRVNQTYTVVALSQEELDAIVATKWQNVRSTRNTLLTATDWTQLLDSPITPEKQTEYTTYRQTLRDIPQSFADPDLVVYPDPVA